MLMYKLSARNAKNWLLRALFTNTFAVYCTATYVHTEWYYFTLHTATRTYDFGSLSALTVLAWVSALHRAISTTSHPTAATTATATSDSSSAVRTTRSSSTGSSSGDNDRDRGPLAQAQFLFQQVTAHQFCMM
jgi:hypothetical protein